MNAPAFDIDRLIDDGESEAVEFKSSLRCDRATGNVNRDLTKIVAKTMAGFLNGQGGTLLIGVGDQGTIDGIEADIATLSRGDRDGFEQTLRTALAKYLGVEITPGIQVAFAEKDGLTVSVVSCSGWHQPVFFQDGDRREFYVRDGNTTRPFDVRAAYEYIGYRWPPETSPEADIKRVVAAALTELGYGEHKVIAVSAPTEPPGDPEDSAEVAAVADEAAVTLSPRDLEAARDAAGLELSIDTVVVKGETPAWLRVGTRRVLNLFLGQLASATAWKRLFIISPWISALSDEAALSFESFVRRLQEDEATVYVVTRPPVEAWHQAAVDRLAESGRANVALVPDLHAKLYTAVTAEGEFAMLGSANFTQQSLTTNREIGLLVNAYEDGKRVVRDLTLEASQIYRVPGRTLAHKANFRLR